MVFVRGGTTEREWVVTLSLIFFMLIFVEMLHYFYNVTAFLLI